MPPPKALIVGLSGCSSSGKTTLARLLRDIFPNTFILHQDDFYKPEPELPKKDGLLDWDCAGAIDVPGMADSLSYIREHASFPVFLPLPYPLPFGISIILLASITEPPEKPTLDSKEDKNSVGKCPVPDATVHSLKAKVSSLLAGQEDHPLTRPAQPLRLCLLDGFLLYSPSMSPIHTLLDIRLFLRTTYAKAKARREARDGYVTIEGFWADPPGYVDKIVWPNYVEEHAFMFEGGDVEGSYRFDVLEREGIQVQKDAGIDGDMGKTLEWAVDIILEELRKLI